MPDPDSIVFRRAPRGLDRRDLRSFAARLRRELAGDREFTCLIAGDDELRRLNRQFLNRDYPTDVLSFPEPGPDGYLGEMAISAQRAAAQAVEHGHSRDEEIKILMLHGVLHLMGMDHEADRGRMKRAESAWRKKLGLPAGLIERARS